MGHVDFLGLKVDYLFKKQKLSCTITENFDKYCNFLPNQLQIKRKDRTFGAITFIINLINVFIVKRNVTYGTGF